MNRFIVAANVLLLSTTALTAQEADVFTKTEIVEFEGQDIDSNLRLIEALSRSAKKGPKFRVSPDKIFMELEEGGIGAETVRLSNVGDEDGAVQGVNSIGSIEGLEVSDNCPEVLSPGGFCDIAVRFVADRPGSIQSVVVVSIEERNRSSFDVPLQIEVSRIEVKGPTEEELRKAEEEKNRPVVVVAPREEPKGPTAHDIANGYFSGLGGAYRTPPKQGFVIVSRPESLKDKSLRGVAYSEVQREVEYSDPRFSEDIPFVEASLPVNRDNILTADRVIKAVLDTPVSNIMCGKVVAVVESDVYSATGSSPLITAGSRAIGRCGNFADERVGIAWDRIITTEGRSIVFAADATQTSDASGRSGGLGRVYRSNFDRFVLPLFSTMIDTASGVIFAAFGENETVTTTPDGNILQDSSAKNEGLRILTENARSTGQELIAEIRDIREVMVLPAGSRIDIEITEDIYFKNEREVIRLADTRYAVEKADPPHVEEQQPEDLVLVPYRQGMQGPTVIIGGQKFVVMESTNKPSEPAKEDTINRVISDLKGDM